MVAHAIDYFLRDVFRIQIQKALDPNDPVDFAQIVAQLQAATKGLVAEAEANALKQALGKLDVDWKKMKPAAINQIVTAAKSSIANPVKKLPEIEHHFEANAQAINLLTKGAAKATFGFKISADLTATDAKVLQHVAFSQGNFVRDEYGKRSDAFGLKAKEIVAGGLAQGWSAKDIGAKLHADLTSQQMNRSRAYWNVVSSSFVARARVYSNLATFQEVGIEWFIFDSVLDQRTSVVCRFMHGRKFKVEHALGTFQKAEGNGGEDIKTKQPWLNVGTKDDGSQFIYAGSAAAKKPVADIVHNGGGEVDNTGKYKNAMSDGQLAARGIMTPPLHGHCRSTIQPDTSSVTTVQVGSESTEAPLQLTPSEPAPIPKPALSEHPDIVDAPKDQQPAFAFTGPGIGFKPLEIPTLDPAAPPVKAYVSLKDKQAPAINALEALKAKIDPANNLMPTPVQVKMNLPKILDDNSSIVHDVFDAGFGKKSKKQVDNLLATWPTVDPVLVEQIVKNPKLLINAPIKVVKVGKEVYVIEGHEHVAAAKLLDMHALVVNEINAKDFQALKDKWKADAATAAVKPAAPPLPPPPVPMPVPPPPKPPAGYGAPIDPADIMHEKTTRPGGGSNGGAFYKDKDGVERFVKLYDNPSQAHEEVLANALYNALGHGSPDAVTFLDPASKKQAYAAKLVDGVQLGTSPSKEQARKFFDGFAADVLSANWDAAGMHGDNAFVLKNGQIIRLDNGGSFLSRAQKGKLKEPNAEPGGKNPVLNGVGELETFFPNSPIHNPGYHAIARKAGYDSVDDFKESFTAQVDKIGKLRAQYGGWDNFVAQYSPGLQGKDRQLVVEMLEARTKGLQNKVEEMNRPPPPKPPPGVKPSSGYRAPPLAGTAPKEGLKLEDLVSKPYPKAPSSGKMPWPGETHEEYKTRTRKELTDNVKADARLGLANFTSSSHYSDIRASERSGKLDANAKRILEGFKQGLPEPCTVLRAISVDRECAEGMIRNGGVFRLGEQNKGATSSATWDSGVAARWGGGMEDGYADSVKVKFIIHQKTGLPIETISHHSHEHEILLSKDSEYRVISSALVDGKKRVLMIELEEI